MSNNMKRMPTARPRTDLDLVPEYDVDTNQRAGVPSSFVRNDDGEVELVPDAVLDAELDDELDAQHQAELERMHKENVAKQAKAQSKSS